MNIINNRYFLISLKLFQMKGREKKSQSYKSIVKDYNRIVSTRNSLNQPFEWTQKGDNFKKLSMYNSAYKTVPSLCHSVENGLIFSKLE